MWDKVLKVRVGRWGWGRAGRAALRGLEGGCVEPAWTNGVLGCEHGSQPGFTRGTSCLTGLVAFSGGISVLVHEAIQGHTATDVLCLNL